MTPYTRPLAFISIAAPLLVIGFSLLLVCGCEATGADGEPLPVIKLKPAGVIRHSDCFDSVLYEVEIDGRDYYAVRVHHGWSLCPKTRSRDILPDRPDRDPLLPILPRRSDEE
jgi:hypothetical protein